MDLWEPHKLFLLKNQSFQVSQDSNAQVPETAAPLPATQCLAMWSLEVSKVVTLTPTYRDEKGHTRGALQSFVSNFS